MSKEEVTTSKTVSTLEFGFNSPTSVVLKQPRGGFTYKSPCAAIV